MKARSTLIAAGVAGATGVALGAFGAHTLHDFLLARGTAAAWETAVRYHLLHAVALLALAVWQRLEGAGAGRAAGWAAASWTAGLILFSGSLYGLALGGPRWLGPVTPLGGVGFLIGWGCLIALAFGRKE